MKLHEDFTTRSKLEDLGRWHVTQFVDEVAAALPAGSRLLDAGAGECAYKDRFRHCRYFAVDLGVGDSGWNYANVDWFARLDRLPLAEGSIDAILCTQVLEHLEWPRESVREFHRVLKPGGRLFVTVPMAQGEHQAPHDYFRYTSFGLKSILSDAGFRHYEIRALGGLPARMAYELPRVLTLFPEAGFKSGRLRAAGVAALPFKYATLGSIRVLQRVLLWADRYDRARNDPFGWSVSARK